MAAPLFPPFPSPSLYYKHHHLHLASSSSERSVLLLLGNLIGPKSQILSLSTHIIPKDPLPQTIRAAHIYHLKHGYGIQSSL